MKYTYTFDQLRDDADNIRNRLFVGYDYTVRNRGGIDLDKYFTADYGVIEADSEPEACEKLFRLYNIGQRPKGYTGRSMSVSDIVTLWDNDQEPPVKTIWFCDSFGFRQIGGDAN